MEPLPHFPEGFEWDDEKAQANEAKHQVSFEEAVTVFGDALAESLDVRDDSGEMREATIGRSLLGRILVVVSTQRNERNRIISARKALPAERRSYEQGT